MSDDSQHQKVLGPSFRRVEPLYIKPNCTQCKTKLMLEDLFYTPNCSTYEIWYDEWVCPKCQDGVIMDWPTWYLEKKWPDFKQIQEQNDLTVVDGEDK